LPGASVQICTATASPEEWARSVTPALKLTFGLPPQAARNAAEYKAKDALQALKQRYNIPDTDGDFSVVQQGINNIVGGAVMVDLVKNFSTLFNFFSIPTRGRDLSMASWNSDFIYAKQRLMQGPAGLERGVKDTLYELEHFEDYGSATTLLRSVIEVGVIYLVVGSIYKSQFLGVSGVEAIPHIGFWRQYPDLVKDGFCYAQQLVSSSVDTSRSSHSTSASRPPSIPSLPVNVGAQASAKSREQEMLL